MPDEPARVPAADVRPVGIDDDPSLRAHLRASWGRLSPRRRATIGGGVLLAVVLVAVLALWPGGRAGEAPQEAREARARSEWAAILRQAPEPLGEAVARGSLGPGDAQMADGRFEDYYAHTRTDSAAVAVVVTSDEFAPDVTVRLPAGRTVAASDLLRTRTRAEAAGLRGPGRFEITVTSRTRGAEGAYEVRVVPEAALDSLYAGGEARLDSLGAGPRLAGRFERVFGLVADPEVPVVVRVVSPAFVPRVALLGPGGEVAEARRLVERRSSGDSLHGVLVRFLPAWNAPYRLLVSSEAPGASGPFAIEVTPIRAQELRADGRGVTAVLGDASWLAGARYVDYYRFTTRAGMRTTLNATSREIPPALRLWRLDRGGSRAAGRALNPGGAGAAELLVPPEPGEYLLEVTTGGRDSTVALGGAYAVVLRSEAIEPPRPPAGSGGGGGGGNEATAATRRVFLTTVRGMGTSGGSTFEVGVTQVALSYPAGRTRVQLSVSVRSVDYTGNWAPWTSFVSKGYVVDDTGRRYAPSMAESVSPSGPAAEPGVVRRGTVVFYAPGTLTGQSRFIYVASVGTGSVTLPIPVP